MERKQAVKRVSRVCTHCMYNEWRGQAIGGEQAVTADTVQPQKVRTYRVTRHFSPKWYETITHNGRR
ncbi:MAG: hypothetical protein ACK53Y_06725 [bacterium]